MAQSQKEFEALDEFEDLAKKIAEKYPEVFYEVDVEEIRCVAITNKSKPEKKDSLWEVVPVKQPVRMDCKYGWYIIVYLSEWNSLTEKQKKLLVADAMCALPKGDEKDGKVEHPDYKDYAVMLRTFGVDYIFNDDAPDLLDTDVQWVVS